MSMEKNWDDKKMEELEDRLDIEDALKALEQIDSGDYVTQEMLENDLLTLKSDS